MPRGRAAPGHLSFSLSVALASIRGENGALEAARARARATASKDLVESFGICHWLAAIVKIELSHGVAYF